MLSKIISLIKTWWAMVMASNYTGWAYDLYHWLAGIPPKIKWGNGQLFTEEEQRLLSEKLASGYYIILTGSRHHLSSIIVSVLSLIKTRRWARYTHVLMNCDNITDPNDRNSFKFVEATATGVHYSTFDEVFGRDCDNVCLLTPLTVSNAEWTRIIDALLKQRGKPYDDLFNLSDSTHVSCVELVLDALKAGDYANDFKNLDALIKKRGNLVPQMYRTCEDFTVDFER
jgi:hypothetical protein